MKKFKDLTLRGQKMRIVKDAILQIETGKFIVGHGIGYLSIYADSKGDDIKSIQKLLNIKDTICKGCAKGAIFAACVFNVNKVNTTDNFQGERFQKQKLKKWFKSLELDMIEAAFEKRIILDNTYQLQTMYQSKTFVVSYKRTALGKACVKFGQRYKKPANRLIAILSNVLQNGEFKP